MGLFNLKRKESATNLAGGNAFAQDPKMQLVSILLTSFAQEQYYRSAQDTFKEMRVLLPKVDAEFAAKAAIFARNEYGMRSITHVLAAELAKQASGKAWSKAFYNRIVRRPDDMLEIAAYFYGKGNKSMPNAMKKGFAGAFGRFDAYQLAKYRGENKSVKLIDLVNLVRPVPNERNAAALKALVRGELRSENTWETKLTLAGQQGETETAKAALKGTAWSELLRNGNLGYLALLRNLRNIAEQAPEMQKTVIAQLTNPARIKQSLVLPFQYLSAIDAVQEADIKGKNALLLALNQALELALDNVPRFAGRTLVVLDDSGSMSMRVGKYGRRTPLQIGALFAAALFKANDADLMRFSDDAAYVSENPGNTLATISERLIRNARAAGTDFNAIFNKANKKYDRIIILSDMQGWMGNGAPTRAFKAWRAKYKANPFVFSFDLQGYGSLMFPEEKVFGLAGFSDKVFDVMQLLETEPKALLNMIEKVSL